jgi:predicted MFS family arabinose efflux permease
MATLAGPAPAASSSVDGISPALTFVFALSCGALVANIYYAQALVTVISPALGLHAGLAGLTVTLTQLGFAAGLVLLVSLADLMENRRLILMCVAGTVIGLCGAALSNSAAMFLISSVVIGVCAVGAQIIVPFAAHLARDERRGRVLGNVMGGLITGIMLARPVANFISAAFGWRAVFGLSAALGVAIAVVLWFALPERRPQPGMSYGQILASSWRLLLTTPVLQRRALFQAIAFGTFNLFWTAVPLVLTQKFGFDQREIALFALAGAGGALAAPIAGRLADRGFTRPALAVAYLTIVAAFALSGWAVAVTFVLALAVAAIALDASVQSGQILAQRVIYGLQPNARGRINAVFMTGIFVAGALGSLLAGVTFFYGGWTATAATGGAFGLILVVLFVLEQRLSTYPRYAPNAMRSQ